MRTNRFRVTAWLSIYVKREHPVQPVFSLRKGSLMTPLSVKLMLEIKLQMAAMVTANVFWTRGAVRKGRRCREVYAPPPCLADSQHRSHK